MKNKDINFINIEIFVRYLLIHHRSQFHQKKKLKLDFHSDYMKSLVALNHHLNLKFVFSNNKRYHEILNTTTKKNGVNYF